MKSTSLIKIFKKLTLVELKRLLKFIHSPYFNQNEQVKSLCKYLYECSPRWDSEALEAEAIFSIVYPNKKPNNAVLKRLFSDTLKLVEEFLVLEYRKKRPFERRLDLLKSLADKGIDNRFSKHFKRLSKELEVEDKLDIEYYFRRFQFSLLKWASIDDYKSNTLEKSQMLLTDYFMASKLKAACELVNRERFLSISYDYSFVDEICQFLEHREVEEESAYLLIYKALYFALRFREKQGHYEELKEMMKRNEHQLHLDDQRDIYQYILNYCIGKINAGDDRFLRELFELTQMLLKRDLLLENDELSEWHYKNMVTLGLRLREFDYVKNFIEAYKPHLPEAIAENAYHYNLANYHFGMRQFDEALVLLNDIEYTDVVYNLDAKVLRLKIYYALEEDVSFYSAVDAFKIYLMRNKLIAQPKFKRYYNLSKLARLAYDLKINSPFWSEKRYGGKLEQLKRKSEKLRPVANLKWIKEQIKILET